MSGFYNLAGGFLWWTLIKFCLTNLSEEQSEIHIKRNQWFFYIIQIVVCFLIIYIII